MGEVQPAKRHGTLASIRHGIGWRVRALRRAFNDRYRPLSARRDAYVRLMRGEFAAGEKSSIVFAVDAIGVDTHAIADVLGLALALAERGHGVQVVRTDAEVPAAEVVVGTSRRFDPSAASPDALRVGWARTEIDRWAELPFLAAYDVVLAPSPMAVARLKRELTRVELFRPGVDAELFGAERDAGQRRRVRTARALKGVARFRLPWLYGHSLVVVDRAAPEFRKYGVVTKRFLEVAASGAVPITNALIGVRELGLTDVPGAGDTKDLPQVLRSLPPRRQLSGLGKRLGQLVVAEHSWALRAEQLADQILPDTNRSGRRRVVHVAPFYRGNPYQAMLYAGMDEIDAVIVPVVEVTEHLASRAKAVQPGLFHLHWTNPIVQPADSEAEARNRLDAFVAALDAFAAAGGKLIWTIHNVIPHDARYHDLEIELANEILHHADLVHLLSKETLDLVDGVYDVDPERVVIVEHNSFVGIYPDWISRSGARERLGIELDDKVLIVVGGIRPYKGIDRLLDILDELLEDDPALLLLIAGGAGQHPGIAELEERCVAHPRVISRFKHLPNVELQAWFAAADVAVLPYVNILNSSAFQLAPSFGLPVVGPRMGALTAAEDEPYVRLFDPSSVDDLRDVVKRAVDDFAGDEVMRQTARRSAEARPPAAMAAAFARVIDGALAR